MSTIVWDAETGGLIQNTLLPIRDQPRIIELFALKLDEGLEEIDSLHVLINPGHPLDPKITEITGITDADLREKPTFPRVQKEIANFFLGTKRMVAHNLSFDRDMLSFELKRTDSLLKFPWPIEHVCTVEKTEHLQGFRMTLGGMHEFLFSEPMSGAHRAEADVRALARCYRELVDRGEI